MVAAVSDTSMPFTPGACPRLVVKIGSSLLVDREGAVRREWLAGLADDLAARHAAGQRLVIVSSGAIALGARRLALAKGGRASLEDAQAAAAVGQIALSQAWAELLGARGLTAAQMLVTLDDLEDRRRYLNASATLGRLLSLGAVPVINENDSVATAEIRFGDNDRLAARVGQAAGADGVILLSDVDGLFTANPGRDPSAKLVKRVEAVDDQIRAMAGADSGSGMGSGGMASKLQAAEIATRAGIALAITSGTRANPLAAFAADGRGTLFVASGRARARQGWLGGRLTARGRIRVDAGAVAALRVGKSLLPAGAVGVEGRFERGQVVDIVGPDGAAVARGLAEYPAAEAALIAGRRSGELADLLGHAPRSALVHRDHLVLL
nr:glutamate 5-kinase [Sphingomonas flavalba]